MRSPISLSLGARTVTVPVWICLLPLGCAGGGSPDGQAVSRRGGDLIGAGQRLAITDSIPGDAMVAAGEIDFSGYTGGDYLGAAGRQDIGGRIGGDIRAAGGQIRLGAQVAQNATLAGGQVRVGETGVIGENAYLAGGYVRLDGTVNGLLQMTGDEVVIDGMVGGDAEISASRLRVGPEARILGDLRYSVEPSDVVIDPAAQITGRTIALEPRDRPDVDFGFFRLIWLLGFLAAGAAVVALFPGISRTAAEAVRTRPGASAGLGLLWLIAVPIAVAVVAITIVGVPLALIGMMLYMISLYLARTFIAVWLGRLALRDRAGSGRGGLVVAFLAGGLILVVLALIPVVGGIVGIAATIFGLGALAVALWPRSKAPA